MKINVYIIGIGLLVTGCSIQQPLVKEQFTVDVIGAGFADNEDYQPQAWQDVFADQPLQALITEALANNADVRTMQLNVEQAASQLRTAKLAYLPAFALSPSGTLSKAGNNAMTKTYELPITMQWELNLGGQQGAQQSASRYQWMNAQEQLKYTQVQLIASVANSYYTLVMIDEQLRLSKQSVELQQETLSAMKALKEVGKVNELAVNQTEAALQETITSVSDLALQQEKISRSMNLLIGRNLEQVSRSAYNESGQIMINSDSPVSLEALAMRPDVKSAEYTLRASFHNTRVARSQFYPTLQLNASGSWTNNLGEIINPGKLLLNLVGSLTQPLFQRGQLKAGLEIAKAQQEQAQIAFTQALLQAGNEVADALAECRTSQQKLQAREAQVKASNQAFDNSRELMRHSSSVNYLDVLTAQSAYLNAQLQSTADWLQSQQGKINLFKAVCRYKQ